MKETILLVPVLAYFYTALKIHKQSAELDEWIGFMLIGFLALMFSETLLLDAFKAGVL